MKNINNSFQYKDIFESEPVKAKTSEPPLVGSTLTEPDSINEHSLKRIIIQRKNI